MPHGRVQPRKESPREHAPCAAQRAASPRLRLIQQRPQAYNVTYRNKTSLGESAPEVTSFMIPLARRKLIAILAADVAAYVSLMEVAEEATHARLMGLQSTIMEPAVTEHRGRIVKRTGDGFLTEFDDVTDAVDCALLIQEKLAHAAGEPGMPAILLRIGVHIADVIVEPNDIFGEGVNLTARLQASAEPGGIVVSVDVAEKLRAKPGIKLTDLGLLTLKHIRRPVRAFSVATQGAPVAAALSLAMQDSRPSIAVLPVRRQHGDDKDTWFAEGILEGIIHILSGIENLFVIGHGTSRAYAERDVDPRVVGRELGVRYVLSASVRRAGERLRISTELADAASGSIIRSDRRDGLVTDLFDMQDRIAGEVVASIAPKVREQELARAMRKHPDSMTGYDLVLQALDLLYQLEREPFDRARGLLQQAMAHDPGYAPAYAHAATWHMFRIGQGFSTSLDDDGAEAARCAIAALERDRNNAVALAVHGQVLSFTRHDYAAATHFLDRAIAVGPSSHMAWALSSATRGWIGDGLGAVKHAKQALLLSPLDPFTFFTEHMLSQGYYISGDYAEAIAWGRRSAMRNGLLTSNLRTLAASLVAAGDPGAAHEIARHLLAIEPGFRLQRFAERTPFRREILEWHIPRLRAAGLPD